MARGLPSGVETGLHGSLAPGIPISKAWSRNSRSDTRIVRPENPHYTIKSDPAP